MHEGLKLAVDTAAQGAQKAEGFATPAQDKAPQVARFTPKRVLPIVFLPGIMGSNLRIISKERQELLKKQDNKAWRPDELGLSTLPKVIKASKATPEERQLQLDPLTTDVDTYEPTGKLDVSGDDRHSNVQFGGGFNSPLLVSDPPTSRNPQTALQKARSRGWGEVMFASYGELLQLLETRMNNTFVDGHMDSDWHDVIGVDPARWQADARLPQQALTEDDFKKAVSRCIFPVYAFGYNWLKSNGTSAIGVAKRIEDVIQQWKSQGYECEKVIVITHSMGGLVAKGLLHPDHGNIKDKVLGMVHGVMPSIGAGTAYRRMRAGFENPGEIASKVAGNNGHEVTAVLANSPGGLQLLPSKSYGNGWLKVVLNNEILGSLPKNGDPYDEIYKLKDRWYSLFREKWINPSNLSMDKGGGDFSRTIRYVNQARDFHEDVKECYHETSYAHYGVDPKRLGWGDVVWEISPLCGEALGWESWKITSDNKQGTIMLTANDNHDLAKISRGKLLGAGVTPSFMTRIVDPAEPGDQTVPMRSSDAQLRSGKFKAIFRQHGYEHQGSYQNAAAIASTLYSIVRIAQQAKWKSEK